MQWSEQKVEQIYIAIGDRIRTRRTDLKLTQLELGQRVQLTRSSIANIEAGRQRPMPHTILQIACQLDIEPAELLPKLEEATPENSFLHQNLHGQPESTFDFVRSVVRRVNQ